jgi:hypothetical protein
MIHPLDDPTPLPEPYTVGAAPRLRAPSLSGRMRIDVAIVGAGYTGLSTALHLRWAGVSSVVLEAREVVAVAVAAIAFFSLHEFNPRFGVIWNLIHGEVWLTASCAINQSVSAPDVLLASPPTGPAPHWPACDLVIPYRLILGLAFATAAAAQIPRSRN